ncbi:hypothetical protein ACGFJC_47270 [Nonomuraea fuscirosea]|uniref:hypothetical protein n=1 Tax=Nonomuraea fuscirosea TaxID=1291556 RepID=UPI003722FD78
MNAVDPATLAGHVSAADIAALPADTSAEHMAEIMNASQPNLAAVVLAEADKKAPRSASKLLRSPQWADDWLYTLIALEGMLRVATARADVRGDRARARAAWRRARLVSNRIIAARTLADSLRREARQAENMPPAPVTALRAARWALARRHNDELTTIRQEVLADDGRAELDHKPPTDDESFFAMAARTGLLTPVDQAAADHTLNLDWETFVDQVAADVCSNDGIDAVLRDPVIVHLWGQALAHIHRRTCDVLGIDCDPGDNFPVMTLNLRSLDTDTAERKLRQLRYLASVRARWVEQQHLQRDLKHRAAQQHHSVLSEATNEAITILTEEYAPEYTWLINRMDELADPATGLMPADWRSQRNTVLAGLAEQLRVPATS